MAITLNSKAMQMYKRWLRIKRVRPGGGIWLLHPVWRGQESQGSRRAPLLLRLDCALRAGGCFAANVRISRSAAACFSLLVARHCLCLLLSCPHDCAEDS